MMNLAHSVAAVHLKCQYRLIEPQSFLPHKSLHQQMYETIYQGANQASYNLFWNPG